MTDRLELLPDRDQEKTRENMRRIEEWAKKRAEEETSIRAEALKMRFLLMGA